MECSWITVAAGSRTVAEHYMALLTAANTVGSCYISTASMQSHADAVRRSAATNPSTPRAHCTRRQAEQATKLAHRPRRPPTGSA